MKVNTSTTQPKTPIHQYYFEQFVSEYSEVAINSVVIESFSTLETLSDSSVPKLLIPRLLNTTLDYEQVILHAKRVLEPNGVVLCSANSIALPIDEAEALWGFTIASMQYVFEKYFSRTRLEIKNYGNALAGRLLLEGSSADSVDKSKLDAADPYFPVVIGVKATKEYDP